MIWTLYRLELFKTVKRLATWITFFSFAVIIMFMFGTYYYNGIKYQDVYFGFPDAWPRILTDGAYLADIFTAVFIALLVASEFDWRTGRQNIIDGLSRGQWFTAKLLLLPTAALLFYGSELILAGILAWLGTDPGKDFAISGAQVLTAAGVYTGILCYASVALFIALLTRSAGPALGVTVIYQVFETLITRTLRGFELETLADCFPFQVHLALFRYDQFQPEGSLPKSMPGPAWETDILFAACAGWIIVFITASWLVYWKRDL